MISDYETITRKTLDRHVKNDDWAIISETVRKNDDGTTYTTVVIRTLVSKRGVHNYAGRLRTLYLA